VAESGLVAACDGLSMRMWNVGTARRQNQLAGLNQPAKMAPGTRLALCGAPEWGANRMSIELRGKPGAPFALLENDPVLIPG
jgi:hypothetical protein